METSPMFYPCGLVQSNPEQTLGANMDGEEGHIESSTSRIQNEMALANGQQLDAKSFSGTYTFCPTNYLSY